MSTNYFHLKFNEIELTEKLYHYWKHAINMHRLISNFLLDFPADLEKTNTFNSQILKLEKQSNRIRAELFEDAIWFLSRNQPHAGHLRFIVAIIISTCDLERICDYGNNIRKFLISDRDFLEEVIHILASMSKVSVDIFSQILVYFTTNSANDTYQFSRKKRDDFKKLFHQNIQQLKKLFTSLDAEMFVDLVLALKCMERIIDHTLNIIKQFVYIKCSDFFFKH